ncbi:hypothetical protein HUJ04_005497 [Dendroctonus ponderosae]|uniref:EGF domain-specific O-linked N-acetylglucosamine transferase n=2 Tax=Dendroctonus ponderosae TaxID=77166 RepID=A0AAR5Q921_DENPD|nr:hypothetical protein HUJ04_005497 [Dendroctonus ponderosae]
MSRLVLLVLTLWAKQVLSYTPMLPMDFSEINLPSEHLQYYFSAFPSAAQQCHIDDKCPYKMALNAQKYWGYTNNSGRYSTPECTGWGQEKRDNAEQFYREGDFGFIKQQLAELTQLCSPFTETGGSSLHCTDHLRYCRGSELMLNFTKLSSVEEPFRYNMSVLSDSGIGGYCEPLRDEFLERSDHVSALQSWGPELRYFTQLTKTPRELCDIVITKPTYLMKIDATFNMYHHFCDFFNLYASQHMNQHLGHNAFSTDVHMLIWETFDYRSPFRDTWEAFTDYPLWDLKTFRGRTVCFENVILPLLPRMVFGLYYNTPLTRGCRNSGLFHAFSKHILHRLQVPVYPRLPRKIRVTLLCRDTKYRRILNEDELFEAINENEAYQATRVVFNANIPFKQQLKISANTDVLVGIHGAGLTHLLFLPDWATVFELYNCEDHNCYSDLARLRGVNYITWRDKLMLFPDREIGNSGEADAKFKNYAFDVGVFKGLLKEAAGLVMNHTKFIAAGRKFEHEEL